MELLSFGNLQAQITLIDLQLFKAIRMEVRMLPWSAHESKYRIMLASLPVTWQTALGFSDLCGVALGIKFRMLPPKLVAHLFQYPYINIAVIKVLRPLWCGLRTRISYAFFILPPSQEHLPTCFNIHTSILL